MSHSWAACLSLVAVILAGCQTPPPIVVVPPPTLEPTAIPTLAPIRVYISGAVANPGVYLLPARSLGEDALQVAGGPTTEADLEQVNLAYELHDQEHYHVPRKSEPVRVSPAAETARININTATVQELDRLPSIGPATAQLIVDFRTRNGPFQRIEDIMAVKGIGQAKFDQIKELIAVGD